jgi:hypothetical protein
LHLQGRAANAGRSLDAIFSQVASADNDQSMSSKSASLQKKKKKASAKKAYRVSPKVPSDKNTEGAAKGAERPSLDQVLDNASFDLAELQNSADNSKVSSDPGRPVGADPPGRSPVSAKSRPAPSQSTGGGRSNRKEAHVRTPASAEDLVTSPKKFNRLPEKKSDGTFARPRGRAPSGCEWDAKQGLWAPIATTKASNECDQRLTPEGSKENTTPSLLPQYVACGTCESCRMDADCGACLHCKLRGDLPSEGSLICARRICINPVDTGIGRLNGTPPAVSDEKEEIEPEDSRRTQENNTEQPRCNFDNASVVQSLSDADSFAEEDDMMVEHDVAAPKVVDVVTGADLARQLRNADRAAIADSDEDD